MTEGTGERERLERLARYFEGKVAFAGLVGLRVGEMEPGRAVLYVDVGAGHLNGNGTLHGGVHATLVDSAMSLALLALVDRRIATTQMNVHFVGPAGGGRVTCRGEVLQRTRRTATAEGRVFDEGGGLIAHGTGAFRVFEERGDPLV